MQELIDKIQELSLFQKEWYSNHHVYYIISKEGKIGTYVSSKPLKKGDVIENSKICYR